MGPGPKGTPRKGGTCLCLLRFAGKEITLLMQTLNTLSTPEEKLAALCKKYAELVSSPPCLHTLPASGGQQTTRTGLMTESCCFSYTVLNGLVGAGLSWERTGSEEELKDCEAREPEGLFVSNEKASLILGIILRREMVNQQ